MSRRRLSGIHVTMARHAAEQTAPTPLVPSRSVEQLSIAALDQAGARLLPPDLCPDCMGTGETEQHVTDDITRMRPCRECGGAGRYL